MADLKLAKLPDRTPVKLTVVVPPGLAHDLQDYRDLYQEIYGAAEDITELIPYMLAAFIDNDAGFKKARRDLKQSAADSEGLGRKTNHGVLR
jgi:hypothetical protein